MILSTLTSVVMLSAVIPAGSTSLGSTESIVPGDIVSEATFQDSSGAVLSWKVNKPTLFVVVGYWCDTWKVQLPRVAKVRQMVRDLPVDIRVVSIDGRWTELGTKRGHSPDFVDVRSRWSASLGLDKVPYSFVVDEAGTVRWTKYGIARSEEMAAALTDTAEKNPNSAALNITFDDFPSPGDEKLLDLLYREDVQATFFVIGEKLGASPELVKRAIREGHQIEIHGWKHDPNQVNADRCARVLDKTFGVQASFIRHPGSEMIFNLSGEKMAVRTTNPYDYTRPGAGEISRRVLNHVRKDGVILLHSGVDQTVEALPKILRNLRRLNYRFSLLR